MESKREQIINGLRVLREECKKESSSNCPDKCPYDDICEMISVTGCGKVVIPSMLRFEELKDFSK